MSILRKKTHFLLGATLVLFFILYRSVIIIPEGYSGLFLPGAKSVFQSNTLLKPGIHFILPYLMRPILLDNRLQTLTLTEVSDTGYSQESPITIAYYVNWSISNPLRFYEHTKNNSQKIKHDVNQQLTTLFNDKNAKLPLSQLISKGTTSQMESVLSKANKKLETAGIKLMQIGFQQLHLSPHTNERLLDIMRTKQENKAIALRAEGKANAGLIRANADNSAHLILAKAKEMAAHIRAQGDADAAKLYNQAYMKNPTFAVFYLNLQTYLQGFQQPSTKHFLGSNTKEDLAQNETAKVNLTETNSS